MTKSTLSVREMAREIGICKTKIYEEMRAGRIQARKSGRRTLIPAAEAERYLLSLPSVHGRGKGTPGGHSAEGNQV